MSLCLSADATPFTPTAPAPPSLSERLRRFLLSFDPVDEGGDMLPAPVADRANRRRRPVSRPDEVNALLL